MFYLSFQVKLQFFKTFILPYFDYCSTLIIYFTKTIIQKIANYYYYCLSRLLNFKCTFSLVDSFDFNNINNSLEKLGLQALQHRNLIRLMCFSHKLFNNNYAPVNLVNLYMENNNPHSLRSNSANTFFIPKTGILNKYGERTFHFFFSRFINLFCKNSLFNDLAMPFKLFKNRTFNNVNIHFEIFIKNFSNFDIKYVLR